MPAGGSDTPVYVRLSQSSANFGTFTSITPGKLDSSNGETLQGTYGKNATVEPTSPTYMGLEWEVQPQSGVIEFFVPLENIPIPGGKSLQVECTSPATPILLVILTIEE